MKKFFKDLFNIDNMNLLIDFFILCILLFVGFLVINFMYTISSK